MGIIVVLLAVIVYGLNHYFDEKKLNEKIQTELAEVERLEKELKSYETAGEITNLVIKDGRYLFEMEEDKSIDIKSSLFHKVITKVEDGERVEFVNTEDEFKFGYEYKLIYYPKLAILIDDVGMNTKTATLFNELGIRLNFAILPFLPRSLEAGNILREAGHTTILHMPMEGSNDTLNDRTEGLIFEKDNPKEIFDAFDKALEDVGPVIGFNNHMGSRFTSNEEKMEIILEYAKKKGLYYVDSNTSIKNKGYKVAKELGIPTTQCNLFLDNSKKVEDIEKQIAKALEIAKKKGSALVIGHYHTNMAEALKNSKELIEESKVKLVHIEEILE
jgi:hypothetical protein